MVVLCLYCARSQQVAFSKCLFARDDGLALKVKQVLTCSENGLWGGMLRECSAQYSSLNVPD